MNEKPQTAVEWVRDEIGAYYSQSFDNINVPELALTRLVRERNQLKSRVEELERDGAKLRKALKSARGILWMAQEYAAAGGSKSQEMQDYAAAETIILKALGVLK